jgi:hypothetical protein
MQEPSPAKTSVDNNAGRTTDEYNFIKELVKNKVVLYWEIISNTGYFIELNLSDS